MEPRDEPTTEAFIERIRQLTATRAWPWMEPGAVSVALDEEGRVTRYVATETELIPLGPA